MHHRMMRLHREDQVAHSLLLLSQLEASGPDLRLVPGDGGEQLRLPRLVLTLSSPFLTSLLLAQARYCSLHPTSFCLYYYYNVVGTPI